MSIEGDVENPDGSPIFSKYPAIQSDHHIMEFVTDYLRMMVGGNLNTVEIESLMDVELETHHHEAVEPAHVVSKVGDATPSVWYCCCCDGGCERYGFSRPATGRSWKNDRWCAGGYFPGDSDFLWFCGANCRPSGSESSRRVKNISMYKNGVISLYVWLCSSSCS